MLARSKRTGQFSENRIKMVSIGLQIARLTEATSAYPMNEANESTFEPERKQTDGGQQMIASASENLAAPMYKWNNEDHNEHNEQDNPDQTIPEASTTRATSSTNSMERRADRDPEEEFDDDERDEDKSGSSQHDSFENPSFGESRKAARDGEEIENFFDKHLGPPTSDGAAGGGSLDSDSDMSKPVVSERVDPDDGYETAASSPLSDIFHTLIKAHRRPFVITTTQADDNSSNTDTNQPQSAPPPPSNQQQSAATTPLGSQSGLQQTSASNPMSSPSQVGPFIRGSPFMGAPFPGMAQATAMPPLAYFAPIGSPSNLNPYERPAGMAPPDNNPAGQQEDYANGGPGARDHIYIVRRPSVLQHIRAVAPPLQRLVQQSSNAHWRGLPLGAPPHFMGPMHPAAYQPTYPSEESPPQQLPTAASAADYQHYPIGAHSYSYPREQQPHAPSREETTEDEPTSYSLSFGGHHQPSSVDSNNDEQDNGQEELSSVDEAPGQNPDPYQSGGYSSAGRNPMPGRFTSSSTRAYNNYNYPPPIGPASSYSSSSSSPAAYSPPQTHHQGSSLARYHQGHYHGARYHKDPSESPGAHQPINNYAQYSPFQSGSNQREYASWLTRQQLLANLDRQIKNNQYYRQNMGQQSTLRPQGAPITVQRRFKTRLSEDDHDVESYSSFHSEVDPYKSFTASSKLVNEPQSDGTLQKGRHREPSVSVRSNEAQRIGVHRNEDDGGKLDDASNKKARVEPDQAENDNSSNNEQPNRNLSTGLVSGSLGGRKKRQQHRKQQEQEGSSGDPSRGHWARRIQANHRVRREDVDDRENDEVDDDGVWVDDDEDDDNRQTASDLNETSQDPEEGENQQEVTRVAPVPGVIGDPHGYELSR